MEGIDFTLLFILICVCFAAFIAPPFSFKLLFAHFPFIFSDFHCFACFLFDFTLLAFTAYLYCFPSFCFFFPTLLARFAFISANLAVSMRTKIASVSLRTKSERRLFIGFDSFCSWQHTVPTEFPKAVQEPKCCDH